MNNTGKIISAIAVGVTAGVVLGILFAPDKGSETRKKIVDQKNKTTDGIKTRFGQYKEKLSALKEEID